jgi:acyl-CoA reductase-like NAD-dependent aldehyde dehydrogenase
VSGRIDSPEEEPMVPGRLDAGEGAAERSVATATGSGTGSGTGGGIEGAAASRARGSGSGSYDRGDRGDPAPSPEGEEAPPPPAPRTELRIHRPADRGLVGVVPVDPVAVVEASVVRARIAQEGWAALPLETRMSKLAELRREVGRRTDDIVDRILAETGKPEEEALAEVLLVMRLMRYHEKRARRVLGPRRVRTGPAPGGRGWVEREPLGVVGILSAWNYPFLLAMDPVVTALAAGNGAVLKPSEHSPFTGAIIQELAESAGLPEDLVLVVQGEGATGEALVDARPDHLYLVGGTETGRAVLARASKHLLPVSLELGGKDAALVLEDADLELAARGIAFGAFYGAGQTCISVERVYVAASVYEPFLRRLVREARGLRVGSAGGIDVGPMTLESQMEKVEAQLADAEARGARILCGGHRADPASNIFLPTVVADVPPDARVLTDETFGPVVAVVPVEDEDEAVARVNRSPLALFASVWSRDRGRGKRVAARLRVGGVSVNDVLSHFSVPGFPMGGVGDSGWSRMRGDEGLRTFSRARVLLERGGRKRDWWWFPYGASTRRRLRAAIGWEQHRGLRGVVAMVVRLFSREVR